jgi:hypothetical protein
MKYKLSIQEHDEYGLPGIVIKDGRRDYFDPATEGLILAHDLLEHPTTPDSDGYVDELMALGAIVAGRMAVWCNPYGRYLDTDDLVSDIRSLTLGSFAEHDSFNVRPCHSRVQDSNVMETMRMCVRKGLLEAVNQHEDANHQYIPRKYNFDIDSMVARMARGHQQFRKRFPSLSDFTYLFREITEVSDRWLKGAELGDTAVLTVVHRTQTVHLSEDLDSSL